MSDTNQLLREAYQTVTESEGDIETLFGETIPNIFSKYGIHAPVYVPKPIDNGAMFVYKITKHPLITRELIDNITAEISALTTDADDWRFETIFKQKPPFTISVVIRPK